MLGVKLHPNPEKLNLKKDSELSGLLPLAPVNKADFLKLWAEIENKEITYRAFYLISSDKKKRFCTIDDFRVLFQDILEYHAGLEFLKDTPDFQGWYSLCVIHRMFYMANRKCDYKMTYREFKNSRILQSILDIEN